MDNLSCHTSTDTLKTMKDLGYKWVFNCTYSPEYNPIEFTFSKVKREFKRFRAKKMTGLIQEDHEALIRRAVRTVKK